MIRKGNQYGFSLVELMIVVAIIGVLVPLAQQKFTMFRAKANQAEAKVILSYIANEFEILQEDPAAINISARDAVVISLASETGGGNCGLDSNVQAYVKPRVDCKKSKYNYYVVFCTMSMRDFDYVFLAESSSYHTCGLGSDIVALRAKLGRGRTLYNVVKPNPANCPTQTSRDSIQLFSLASSLCS